jgi:hypothetical protein
VTVMEFDQLSAANTLRHKDRVHPPNNSKHVKHTIKYLACCTDPDAG